MMVLTLRVFLIAYWAFCILAGLSGIWRVFK